MANAARCPGGHATAYEARKHATYGTLCQREGYDLIPVIVDSFGAWGAAALAHFRKLAAGISRRFGEPYAVVLQLLMLEANIIVIRGQARLMLAATASATE
jgi:hypothetical protein